MVATLTGAANSGRVDRSSGRHADGRLILAAVLLVGHWRWLKGTTTGCAAL